MHVAGQFCLTVSLPKTKDMAVQAGTGDAAVSPLRVEGGTIEMVTNFICFCLLIGKLLVRWFVGHLRPSVGSL